MKKEYPFNPETLIVPNTNNIDLWKYQIRLQKELERIEMGVKINYFWDLQEGKTDELMYSFYGMILDNGKLYYSHS